MDIAGIRKEYTQGGLDRKQVPENPFLLFEQWLREAIAADVTEPTAMVVGTVSPEGRPATRTVLLKELHGNEFIFYTNYKSRKGMHLAANPFVSLSFVWYQLERQVHVEGQARQLPASDSDAYFGSRPYKSRIGARISPQSQPINSRNDLIRMFMKESLRWLGRAVQRPAHWGGYAVIPDRIEFWQGRESRLHDRILYTLQTDGHWEIRRLAP